MGERERGWEREDGRENMSQQRELRKRESKWEREYEPMDRAEKERGWKREKGNGRENMNQYRGQRKREREWDWRDRKGGRERE